MRRRVLWFVVAAVAVVALALGITYSIRNRKEANASQSYQTSPVRRGDVELIVSATGEVICKEQYDIRSKLSGEIAEVLGKQGDMVAPGQVIVKLEQSEIDAKVTEARDSLALAKARLDQVRASKRLTPDQTRLQVEQAHTNLLSAQNRLAELKAGPKPEEVEQVRSSVRQAEANHESARADYERLKGLYKAGAVARQQLDAAEAKLVQTEESLKSARAKLELQLAAPDPGEVKVAEAQLAQAATNLKIAEVNAKEPIRADDLISAEAEVRKAERNLADLLRQKDDALIRSPITGTILAVSGVRGDTVSPQNSVATVADLSKLQVRSYIDESEIGRIAMGQAVNILADAFPDDNFTGRVSSISHSGVTKENLVSFEVIIDIDDPKGILKPGMTVDSDIFIIRKQDVLTVPNSSVTERRGRPMVAVLENGEPVYRRVEVGISNETLTEIVSGLKEREMVVTGQSGAASGSSQSSPTGGGMTGGMGGGNPLGGLGGIFRR